MTLHAVITASLEQITISVRNPNVSGAIRIVRVIGAPYRVNEGFAPLARGECRARRCATSVLYQAAYTCIHRRFNCD